MAENENLHSAASFDIIIAGGGAAGCVVAGRLAAAHKELSILLIESGKNNYQQDNVVNPGLFREHLSPGSRSVVHQIAKPLDALNNRSISVAAANILGGGSSVNFMLYSRATLRDFDSWNTPGWTGKDMKGFLSEFEIYHGHGESNNHGSDGLIHISSGTFRSLKVENALIRAAEQVGYPEVLDLQDLKTSNACERALRFVSPDGFRQDTAHCYIHPLLSGGQHPNLHLLLESKVVRVVFDKNQKAVGVEYQANSTDPLQNLPTVTSKKFVKAKKMVVLSCGALGTPPVLERSGIGNSQVLHKASVHVIVDNPGVGSNYQDHHCLIMPFYSNLETSETHDDFRSGRFDRDKAISNRIPRLGWNGLDVCMKIRPTHAEVLSLGPDFKASWEKDFEHNPSKPLMLLAFPACFPGHDPNIPPGQYVTITQHTVYPYSRGHIHIMGPELSDELDFDVGFLTDPQNFDLKSQIWAYKKSREIIRRTQFYCGEVERFHPKFPAGSKAACVRRVAPSEEIDQVCDLSYSLEDDKAIEQHLRDNIGTTWHSLGTAKMAPRHAGGVVDSNLNVYGVTGLKLIDMSIVPQNVCAHTNHTAIAIGEKGADIILRELDPTSHPVEVATC